MDQAEKELRDLWTAKGVSAERQDELMAAVTAKAQPGTKVGPYTIGQPTGPRLADFAFRVGAEGYMLMYKGVTIGGVSILGKYRGNQRQKQIAEYANDARREVEAISGGRGQKRFLDAIARIDKDATA